jgi:hypothetical protein
LYLAYFDPDEIVRQGLWFRQTGAGWCSIEFSLSVISAVESQEGLSILDRLSEEFVSVSGEFHLPVAKKPQSGSCVPDWQVIVREDSVGISVAWWSSLQCDWYWPLLASISVDI